jgi:hypothetical protein
MGCVPPDLEMRMPTTTNCPPGMAHLPAFAALLVPFLAVGCAPAESFPPQCPALVLLKDGADLKRFNGPGRDVTDLAVDGRITKVDASCTRDSSRAVRATLSVNMELARGPTGPRSIEVPYFIAVAEGDRILDRQEFSVRGSFPPNVDRTSVQGQEVTLKLPVTDTKNATAYRIFVSFSLTPDELAYNRRTQSR